MLLQGASAPVTPAHAASFQGPQISLEVMQAHLRFPGLGRIKVSIGSNSYVAELRHVIGAKLSTPPAQIRLIYGGGSIAPLHFLVSIIMRSPGGLLICTLCSRSPFPVSMGVELGGQAMIVTQSDLIWACQPNANYGEHEQRFYGFTCNSHRCDHGVQARSC